MAAKQLPGIFDADYTDVSETQNDVDDQIDMVLSELGSDPDEVHVKIGVYKSLAGKGKVAWLFDTLPDEMPDIKLRIRNQYGSGDYEFRVYKNGRIFKRCRFCVEAPTRPDPTPQAPQNSELSSILHMMLEQQNKQADEFKALIVGLNNKPQQSMVDNLGPMIGLMLQAKQLFAQPQQNNGNQIDMLLKGVELAKEIGGGGGESTMMDVVRDLLKSPILGEAIKLGAQQGQAAPRPKQQPPRPPQPMIAAPVVAAQTLPPQQKVEEESPMFNMSHFLIRAQIDLLIKAASNNTSPDIVAAQILDNAPDSVLENYIFVGNAIEKLAEIHPGILQHRNWFENVQGHIFSLYEQQQGEDDEDLTNTPPRDLIDHNGTNTTRIDGDAGGSGGNTDDTQANVAVGTVGENVGGSPRASGQPS